MQVGYVPELIAADEILYFVNCFQSLEAPFLIHFATIQTIEPVPLGFSNALALANS